MVTTTLVDGLVDSGRELLTALHRRSFDISAAAWLLHEDGDIWRLYIVTKSLASGGVGDSMNVVFDCLSQAGEPDMELFNAVRLLRIDEPLGRWLMSTHTKLTARPASARTMIDFRSPELEQLGFAEGRLYPPSGPMTTREVIRAVADRMAGGNALADFWKATGKKAPTSIIQFRNGSTGEYYLVGISARGDDDDQDVSGGIHIHLKNPGTGQVSPHRPEEIYEVR